MTALTTRTPSQTAVGCSGPNPAGGAATGAVLVVRRGPDVGRRWLLDASGITVVGREAGCDVRLAHLSVSRRHAEIRAVGGGWELRDLGSLVGSYVNGAPVDRAVLRDGDEIALGVFRLAISAPG